MEVKGIMLSEISQAKKDKYCVILLKYGIWKIWQTREYNKKEEDSQI